MLKLKVYFSFALTLMDNIWVGKKNENGWGPFSRRVCGSELKRSYAMDGNLLKNELQRRFMTIMESVNWVCEDGFKGEHEWVTQYHFGRGGSNLGGPGLQLRGSVRDTVGSLMVLGTFTFQSVSRGEWDTHGGLP